MAKLSGLFTGIAAKRLTAVEVNPSVSNQHEFQGVKPLIELYGTERRIIQAKYIFLGDSEEETITEELAITWYDARENQPTRTPEYRLYYKGNIVIEFAKENDLLIIAVLPDGKSLFIVVKQGVTYESQVLWLFGLNEVGNKLSITKLDGEKDKTIGFVERTILEAIGISSEPEFSKDWLGLILDHFGPSFPSTREFSQFARTFFPSIDSIENPDLALIEWINHEEMLFHTLEKYIVEERIRKNFETVDDFVAFSMSVHQRRKSRMGYALENHLEKVFIDNGINYSRSKETENRSSPDFLFPSIESYRNLKFPDDKLTMLGSKSTCKDRWRQILSEAKRIDLKHLFTLEPGISVNQTSEMKANNVSLVVPESIMPTYSDEQQSWLLTLGEFVSLVRSRQLA